MSIDLIWFMVSGVLCLSLGYLIGFTVCKKMAANSMSNLMTSLIMISSLSKQPSSNNSDSTDELLTKMILDAMKEKKHEKS